MGDFSEIDMPKYFLADLEDQSALSPTLVKEACITIKSNRRRVLIHRTTKQIVDAIEVVAEEWRDPESLFRTLARDNSPSKTGFPPEVVDHGLQDLFESVDRDSLLALIEQDLGHQERLDRFLSTQAERMENRQAIAWGPELIVHITGGLLPNPAIISLILGFLVRSAQFMKCATGTSYLPRLFLHSLYKIDPALASTVEIAEWPGGTEQLEEVIFSEADIVCAVGTDETLYQIRKRLPPHVKWIGYGHKISFAYIGKEVLRRSNLYELARLAAEDITAWNQLGCLSPHVIYVQTGGQILPELFAETLAQQLQELEKIRPRGEVPLEVASHITHLRSFFQVRAAASPKTKIWTSPNSTAWTVIYDEDPLFQLSCMYRLIFVKAVQSIEDVLEGVNKFRGKVSTVGLAAGPLQAEELGRKLATWGVTRICPIGQMQKPPICWRHDGRPSLGELVFWTDWEQGWR